MLRESLCEREISLTSSVKSHYVRERDQFDVQCLELRCEREISLTFSVKSRDDRESNTDWDRPPSEFWEVTRPNQRPEGSETLDPFALLGIMGPQHRSRVVCVFDCV